jgi:hypothetical protein
MFFCVQALCSAVEQERLEKVRSILETQTHVNVNGVNGDGFTLLGMTAGVVNFVEQIFHIGNRAVFTYYRYSFSTMKLAGIFLKW